MEEKKIKTFKEFSAFKKKTPELAQAYLEYLKANGRLNWATKGQSK